MICQRCQQRQASVHLTKIVGGSKTEYHLCEPCAKEQGEFFGTVAHPFDITQLLSGILNMESPPGVSTPAVPLRCDNCGMTYNQFTQYGRFGCAQCYQNFAPRLDPLLRRIQSNTTHTGKVPSRFRGNLNARKNLEQLRREMSQCITSEQFERAAELRDQIRLLEQEIDQ